MAKKTQIICTRPGMRRMGVEHPASDTYDEGHWSAEQLDAFRADPAFVVQEIDENAVVTRGPEFDQAVAEEVSKQVADKYMAMQLSFSTAVKDAAAENVSMAEDATAVANAKVAALEAEITELKAAAAKAPAKK